MVKVGTPSVGSQVTQQIRVGGIYDTSSLTSEEGKRRYPIAHSGSFFLRGVNQSLFEHKASITAQLAAPTIAINGVGAVTAATTTVILAPDLGQHLCYI